MTQTPTLTSALAGLGPPRGQTGCSLNDGVSPGAVAAIYYENADTSIPPTTNNTIDVSRTYFPTACNNQPLDVTVPKFAMPVKEPDVVFNFTIEAKYNASGDFKWYMNNRSSVVNQDDPVL